MTGPLESLLRANAKVFDAPPLTSPERDFVILFFARTGSSHLTDLLSSAGVGDPREWLNPDFLAGQAEGLGAADFDTYFTRMRGRFQRQGVFGHEMAIYFYERYSLEVRLEDWFDFSGPSILLFREDLVAQAVSLFLAIRRNLYHRTGDLAQAPAEVPYDGPSLKGCIETLADEERRTRAFIAEKAMTPRVVSYERHTAADPQAVVAAIARHVGVTPKLDKITSPHRKLGDSRNDALATRFRAEYPDLCARLEAGRQWLFDALCDDPLL
ncbi:MAG: hypothetical protein JF615_02295 [Asticcacaulis sp.]|nr:hypothetical protein [Asticcacaulis sp.]